MSALSLIETMRYDGIGSFLHLDRHRARMSGSARQLGLEFTSEGFEAALERVPRDAGPRRVRLELSAGGEVALTHAAFVPMPEGKIWRVAIARKAILSSSDPLLRHKTSRRAIYEEARAEFAAGEADEVLLLNEHGEVCEGTITSLFVPGDDGILITPPLACGLLAGVLRQSLLDSGRAVEGRIRPEVLRGRDFFVGNALRDLIPARLADEKD